MVVKDIIRRSLGLIISTRDPANLEQLIVWTVEHSKQPRQEVEQFIFVTLFNAL